MMHNMPLFMGMPSQAVLRRVYEDDSIDEVVRQCSVDGDDIHIIGTWPWDEDVTPSRGTFINGKKIKTITQWPDHFTVQMQ